MRREKEKRLMYGLDKKKSSVKPPVYDEVCASEGGLVSLFPPE